MVLKGLALGALVATVAVAIFVALTFQPAPTRVTTQAPAANVVVLAGGVAAPQLQPARADAPALIESGVTLSGLVSANLDSAATVALEQRALSVSALSGHPDVSEAVMFKSCGD